MALPGPALTLAPLGAPLTTTHRLISYTYDSLYRLTDAEYSTGEFYQYAYDAVGNRAALTETVGLSQTVHSYQYDAADRVVSVDGAAYTWDDNGNLLSDGARTFTYDAANRLTSVSGQPSGVSFAYDGVGNRTSTTVGGVTTRYVLDIAGGLPEVIAATGSASIQYLQAQGQILAQYDSGTWGYVLPDHLGSVRTEADALGQVAVARSFDPFGVPLGADGGDPFGYTGEWWEEEVGLLHLRARWYAPETGIFLSRDPLKEEPPYLYVQGNPINLTDPSGYYPFEDCKEDDCVVHEVVRFIIDRIREDMMSQEIKSIRALNETRYYEDALEAYEQMPWWQKLLVGLDYFRGAQGADVAAHNLALAQFGCLVADARSRPICGRWDYKKEIGDTWGQAQRIDFCSIGHDEQVVFYYDIWANFHFGYLGMTGGFSEETLLTGADIEHAASNLGQFIDDSSDRVSVKIGVYLYRSALTEETLLRQIYMHRHELNKARVEGGIIREVYQ